MGKSAIEGLGLLTSPKATLLILEAARERAGEGGEGSKSVWLVLNAFKKPEEKPFSSQVPTSAQLSM